LERETGDSIGPFDVERGEGSDSGAESGTELAVEGAILMLSGGGLTAGIAVGRLGGGSGEVYAERENELYLESFFEYLEDSVMIDCRGLGSCGW